MERKRKPASPGQIIREHYLEPMELSAIALAKRLNIPADVIVSVVNETAPITVDLAMRLSRALGTSPELWLNLQMNFDLWNANQHQDKWQDIIPLSFADA